jgi:hypothetical protein
MGISDEEWAALPARVTAFVEVMTDLVIAHRDHGGWRDSPEGLRCAGDGALVVPSGSWMEDA